MKALTLLLLCLNLNVVVGDGTVSVEFVFFSNDGTISNHTDDCEWFAYCDTYFKISPIGCGPGCIVGSYKTSKVYENKNSISFYVGENMGSFYNPLNYSFTKWNGNLELTVYDEDIGGPDDLIARFYYHNNSTTPQPNANSAPTVVTMSLRAKKLLFKFRVYCDPNHYGQSCEYQCTVPVDKADRMECNSAGKLACRPHWYGEDCAGYCKPQNDSRHYDCDDVTGEKICHQAWYGRDCTVFCAPKDDDATGHYTCSSVGKKICLEGWYGEDCLDYCGNEPGGPGRYTCNGTSGEWVCEEGWSGVNCDVNAKGTKNGANPEAVLEFSSFVAGMLLLMYII